MRGLGVIAEDQTDVDTIRVLAQRIVGASLKVQGRQGGGCSHIPIKAASWMRELQRTGCDHIVILHDLDRDPRNGALRDEAALRRRMEELSVPTGVERLVCIPVEELEAWFWADSVLLKGLGGKERDARSNPHLLPRPKEALKQLSMGANRKPRYSTNDNPDLAKKLNLSECWKRCPSYRSFHNFISGKSEFEEAKKAG